MSDRVIGTAAPLIMADGIEASDAAGGARASARPVPPL